MLLSIGFLRCSVQSDLIGQKYFGAHVRGEAHGLTLILNPSLSYTLAQLNFATSSENISYIFFMFVNLIFL